MGCIFFSVPQLWSHKDKNLNNWKQLEQKHKKKEEAGLIFESCPCLWKGEVELEEPTQSLSPPTKPEDQAEQKVEGGRAPACGSWRRWMLGVLPFFPFTAAIALTLHFLTCEYRPRFWCSRLFLNLSCPFKICLFLTDHTSAPVSDLYLRLSSSTLLSVLPRWQRGVPKPELLLRAH